MKLKFMMFVMALAAMGPARDAPPPDGAAVRTPDGATAATQPRDTAGITHRHQAPAEKTRGIPR